MRVRSCATLRPLEGVPPSRPPDLRWDVSGDKRVTSLDVLVILQAAGYIDAG